MCWTLWKVRNESSINHKEVPTIRNIILLIISLVEYWTGHVTKKVKEATFDWLPTTVEAIPLRSWDPNDTQMVIYQGGGE